LYFTSARDFAPTYGQTEFNHIYLDMTKVYVTVLAKGTPNPFAPKLDEEDTSKKEEKKEGDKKDDKKPAVEVNVDADGLVDRILVLPGIPASNYRTVSPVAAGVYYIRQGSKDSQPTLAYFDLATKKETACGSVGNFTLTPDGKKMMASHAGKYVIVDAPKG